MAVWSLLSELYCRTFDTCLGFLILLWNWVNVIFKCVIEVCAWFVFLWIYKTKRQLTNHRAPISKLFKAQWWNHLDIGAPPCANLLFVSCFACIRFSTRLFFFGLEVSVHSSISVDICRTYTCISGCISVPIGLFVYGNTFPAVI